MGAPIGRDARSIPNPKSSEPLVGSQALTVFSVGVKATWLAGGEDGEEAPGVKAAGRDAVATALRPREYMRKVGALDERGRCKGGMGLG